MSNWIVRLAPAVETWILGLPAAAQDAVVAGIEILEEYGPWIEGSPISMPGTLSLPLASGSLVISYVIEQAQAAVLVTSGSTAPPSHLELGRGLDGTVTNILLRISGNPPAH